MINLHNLDEKLELETGLTYNDIYYGINNLIKVLNSTEEKENNISEFLEKRITYEKAFNKIRENLINESTYNNVKIKENKAIENNEKETLDLDRIKKETKDDVVINLIGYFEEIKETIDLIDDDKTIKDLIELKNEILEVIKLNI